MSITVLIPTRNRSDDFLHIALASVKRQTELKSIDRIIVSENGHSDNSKKVCEEFPDLPIEYIKHEPNLDFITHIHWLYKESDSLYTAMLHDDDWWYPTHLELGLKALEDKNCSCYFSNFLFCENESIRNPSFHFTNIISHLKKTSNPLNNIIFNDKEISMLCYLYTPFHMSAMICRTEVIKKVSKITEAISKPFFIDRILYPFISQYGFISFNMQFLVAIRLHPITISNSIINTEKIVTHKECSSIIEKLAKKNNIDILKEWALIKSKISLSEWKGIQNAYDAYFEKEMDVISPFFVLKTEKGIFSKIKSIIKKL